MKQKSDKPKQPLVIMVYNHKGGAAKTTISQNLAMALHLRGRSVLLIDADEQCDTTSSCAGHLVTEGEYDRTLYNVLVDRAPLPVYRSKRGLPFVPSSAGLNAADSIVKDMPFGEKLIRNALLKPFDNQMSDEPLSRDSFDYIIIDCPPGSGLFVEALMIAADALLIVTIPSRFSVNRISAGLGVRKDIEEQAALDPEHTFSAPQLIGICMSRTGRTANIYKEFESLVRSHFPNVYDESIRENKDIEESQGVYTDVFNRTMFNSTNSRATDDFTTLANRFEKECNKLRRSLP